MFFYFARGWRGDEYSFSTNDTQSGQNKTKADYSHNMQANHETACYDILGVLEVSVLIK